MIKIQIKDRLKYLRTEVLSINQEDFGKKINIVKSGISNYEKGTRSITDRTIADICREYNVSEDWLRTGKGEVFAQSDNAIIDEVAKEYNLNDLQKEIVQDFVTLSPDDRKIVTDFIQLIKRQNKQEPTTKQKDLHISTVEKDTKSDMVKVYRAAHSLDNHGHEIVEMSKERLEKIKNAPTVEDENDL